MKSTQVYFDHTKLYVDVLQKMQKLKISRKRFVVVDWRTVRRLSEGHFIAMDVFIKLVEWLDQKPEKYLYKRKI